MHPHHEHRAHKVEKQRVHHITKGYAAGGAVHDDAKEDRAMIKRMVKPSAMKMDGGKARHRADKRARGGKVKYDGASEPKGMKGAKAQMPEPPEMRAKGGRIKHKGTTVNILVGHGGAPSTPPGPMAAPPMAPPVAAARSPMPAGPMPMPPPGAMPIRKHGGGAYASGGGVKSGRAWDEGVRHGTKPVNDPGKNDLKDVGRPRQQVATTYAAGGGVEGRRLVSFYAKGGKVEAPQGVARATKLPGGSGGGEARLAKERRAERDYARA